MNAIAKILIIGDLLVLSGLGLFTPLFAIFIKDSLSGGSIAAVGIAQTIFYITKAVLQIPIARFVDREKANIREFWTLIAGYFLILLIPMLYMVIETVQELYFAQFLFGIAAALAYPGWMSIFTKFANHERAASSWSIYSTSTILGLAVTAAIGGWVAQNYGFKILLLIAEGVIFIGFIGLLWLSLFYDQLKIPNPSISKSFHERLTDLLRTRRRGPPPGTINMETLQK